MQVEILYPGAYPLARVYLQTRNLGPLAQALMPFMPRPSS
jgi:hypothetical protein